MFASGCPPAGEISAGERTTRGDSSSHLLDSSDLNEPNAAVDGRQTTAVVWSAAVTSRAKLLVKILAGASDQNIAFGELVTLLRHLGFDLRTAGSHHIFSRPGVAEILNLQPRSDGTAKPYQVKQVRQTLTRYRLAGEDDAS